jgi:hypothetical protein
MELRLDRLLADLRERPAEILAAIDADPLLIKRTSGGLVLANAGQTLYTPQAQHQLYAKGIVYRRDPYRLVSLPLIKIYNVGERDVTVSQLAELGREPGVRLRFLRKVDGSLVQVFRADGRVWFTTRGMIEGARWRFDEREEDGVPDFDFLASARQMAQQRYPKLIEDPEALQGRTLLFELIHPQVRKVTNYGERADLIFLSCFDHERFAYLGHDEVRRLAERFGLSVVDALSPVGEDLAAQIDSLLGSLRGTDEEGSVICFERGDEAIYRVKVKSPDYLQLMRLMAFCTYERTVEMLDANPQIRTWEDLKGLLQAQGRDHVPEEVLIYYREHWECFQRYLAGLERLRQWALAEYSRLDAEIGGKEGRTLGAYRKQFAAKALGSAYSGLLFTALDGRLDLTRLRKVVRSDAEVEAAFQALGLV